MRNDARFAARAFRRTLPVTATLTTLVFTTVGLYAQQRPAAPATRPAAPASRPADRPVTPAPNPHWSREDCFVCHQKGDDGRVLPIPLTQVNALCWTCHDGKRAHQEVHPVARTFASEDVVQPSGWPAPDGLLSCVTCHNFGPGHARGGPRPEQNAWMLREYTGGSLTEWCAKCHVASPAHKPFNPHVMLTETGEVNTRNCVLCHRVSEGFDRQVRLGKPDLVADEISLCARCHTRHVDWFTPGHIGKAVPPEVRAYMLAREDAGIEGTLTREQVEAYLDDPRQPRRLPLGIGDRVVCSTCHNPHQAGLFPPETDLGMGGMKPRKGQGARSLEMRGLGRGICRGCHNQ
ncbi:MAG TPA: hypothetical protein PL151_01165 [Phycisphaerae bacterium]|nr:hypothetical protein [Phycisphaerae bacterium]HOJ75069.1 hypothetical protein [Phycisphaerae bacterium]HOM51940.1 hypothetical protein [Phycisphaerae bacterium]HON69159.1 hypothetical protein [Phycisphaerae bacterium]HOQ85020.1 hypothetical protein [Phycisphaerae bacterium]